MDCCVSTHIIEARLPTVSASATEAPPRSEEHTSELQSQSNLVCRLLLEKKKTDIAPHRGHQTETDEENLFRRSDRADRREQIAARNEEAPAAPGGEDRKGSATRRGLAAG